MMYFTQYDIEYIILFTVLGILFVGSLHRKDFLTIGGDKALFSVDLQMSSALKGIACIFILMEHWAYMRVWPNLQPGITRTVWTFTGSIALTWFMFFSGYGLSLKRMKRGEHFIKWKQSILKIYIPCLLASVIAFIFYALLPDKFTQDDLLALRMNPNLYTIHHLETGNILPLIRSLLLGNGSWYVGCIIIFYTLFYLASYVAEKMHWTFSYVLTALFLVYFVWAYFYFGKPQAHYYRYCWTFMFGHAVATRTKASWIMASFFLFNLGIGEWILPYIIAIIGLCFMSVLNDKYEVKGKYMLWLGSISYLFYLSHETISYILLTYLHIDSLIVWVILSVIVASILYIVRKRIKV